MCRQRGEPGHLPVETAAAEPTAEAAPAAVAEAEAPPLRPEELSVGMRVEARYHGAGARPSTEPSPHPAPSCSLPTLVPSPAGRWFRGRVAKVGGDGTFSVTYDDGDTEATARLCPPAHLRTSALFI